MRRPKKKPTRVRKRKKMARRRKINLPPPRDLILRYQGTLAFDVAHRAKDLIDAPETEAEIEGRLAARIRNRLRRLGREIEPGDARREIIEALYAALVRVREPMPRKKAG
jgi:hypothetical protein